MIDWNTDDSVLADKYRFDQVWMIVKELKDEDEPVKFKSFEGKNSWHITWGLEFFCNKNIGDKDNKSDFLKLLDSYTKWQKEHYSNEQASRVNH